MKKFLLSFIFVLGTFLTFSQGNLQFNQVLTIREVATTVPAGKVWKVESYQQATISVTSSGAISTCADLTRTRPYTIDGYLYYDIGNVASGSGGYIVIAQNQFPIWLKEGQIINTTCPNDFLSIIEFNIVP